MKFIFLEKAHDKSYPKIKFLSISDKYFKKRQSEGGQNLPPPLPPCGRGLKMQKFRKLAVLV